MNTRVLFLAGLILCAGAFSVQAADPKPAATTIVKASVNEKAAVKKMGRDDLDKDGRLSKAEFMGGQEKYFNKIDYNRDGFITREEKQSYYDRRHGKADEKKLGDNDDIKKHEDKTASPNAEDSTSFIKRFFD